MIRTEREYQEVVKRIQEEREVLMLQKKSLKEAGLSLEEIKRVIDPMESFHGQLVEEAASYERLKRGEFDEIRNFQGIGRLLIALRINAGISQKELADRLGVHQSQISRDERNEYFNITVERAACILDALHVELTTTVKVIEGGESEPTVAA